MKASLAPLVIALAASLLAQSAHAKSPALERAQQLFQENHWAQASAELRAHTSELAPEDQALARLLMGRALAREAEFYRAARSFGNEVALDYLSALAAEPSNRTLAWLPLFTGIHELASGRYEAAARSLGRAAEDKRLPAEWRALARLRRAVARHRLGHADAGAELSRSSTPEGRYWRLVLGLPGDAAPASVERDADRLFVACALLRAGKLGDAEALLSRVDLERPALEDSSDASRLLRFFDPLVLEALERIRWEQAALALAEGGAVEGQDPRTALSSFYQAWSLYRLGERDASRARVKGALAASALSGAARDRAAILAAALAPAAERPSSADVVALWQRSEGDAESVLLWSELQAGSWKDVEPLAQALPARLEQLGAQPLDRATAGRWGFARLSAGADAPALAARLSKLRDNASKNKIERNDPLLLLALAHANYRSAAYAQSVETLFALSQSFAGLRGLHWNLQGVYAARQTAGGEARISP